MTPFKIFKTGCYVAMSGKQFCLSDSQLDAMAYGYNFGTRDAPLVLGHPLTDKPAYGRVDQLDFADGELWATVADVSNDLIDMVREGRYKYVSAAFRPIADGMYQLKHVGFLGAQPPAVKGLGAVHLCECTDCFTQYQGETVSFGEGPSPRLQLPAGYAIDPARLQLHQQALEHQARHGGDYFAAVAAVERA